MNFNVCYMKNLCLTIFLLFTVIAELTHAENYIIIDTTEQPLTGATAIIYNVQMDSIGVSMSKPDGRLLVDKPTFSTLLIEQIGYAPQLVVRNEHNDGDTIRLEVAKQLKEVSVTEDFARQYLTHKSYRLPQSELNRYSTFYQALNAIPNLTVLGSGALFYEGDPNVKLLLNGVETSRQELSALAKDDIDQINVYQTPPIRYAGMGVSAVIDVITKSGLTGGNIGVGVKQSPWPLVGENYVSGYYNYKRSKFSLSLQNENRHFRKYRKNERISYEFDDVTYDKIKHGLDSKSHRDNNAITIGFQNNLYKSYLYSLKAGVDFNRSNANYLQEVTAGNEHFSANNLINTRYNRYWVSNYFEKLFGDRGDCGTFAANVTYQRYNTNYLSGYTEIPDETENQLMPVNERSDYSTRLDAVLGEAQYTLPEKKWGELAFSIYNTYKNSRYIDISEPFSQRSNQFGAAAQYFVFKGKFAYQLQMSAKWLYTKSELYEISYSRWIPAPTLWIYYFPANKLQFRFNYSYDGEVPTIAQLSETEQWIDNHLVYHGNSHLKPYHRHRLSITGIIGSSYIDASLKAGFNYSPDMICNNFTLRPDYILETIINLNRYTETYGQLDVTIKPLGNNVWTFWNRLIAGKIHGHSPGYKWDGYRFQWMLNSSVNLSKWYFNIYYQYPGKISEGQLVRPRGQCWSMTAAYRPSPDMLIGVEWWMPFGKGFKDSERSVGTALVKTENENDIRDWSNMLSVKFSWNVMFGKRHNKARPKFINSDNDGGILTK